VPELVSRVKEFISLNALPSSESPVLVAVSGGSDSVALLRVLLELGYQVHVAHCNFGLRTESGEDEEFVKSLAQQFRVRCFVRRFSDADFAAGRGEGIQQVARRLRYAFFEELMLDLEIKHCAIAHHADDQAETMIQSFFRGMGPVILHGMPVQRGPYFRPLLFLPKAEIVAWLQQRDQSWRHDRSNDKDDYQRNLVRNQLIPVLQRLHPDFSQHFLNQASRHAAHWALFQDIFEPLAQKVVQVRDEKYSISFEAFSRHLDWKHFPLFLDWWLLQKGCSGTAIHEMQRLVDSEIGATYKGVGFELLRDRDQFVFRRIPQSVPFAEIEIPQDRLLHPIAFAGSTFRFILEPFPPNRDSAGNAQMHWLDVGKLDFPLRLRLWRQGDRMQPFGMTGTKLISDILIDQKRDRFAKESTWVLEDKNGIVLLDGYRIAHHVAGTVGLPALRLEIETAAV
jgi:tRNA(Ile)-lysidine synthase